MRKRLAAILFVSIALPGCGGGGNDSKPPVAGATLRQNGLAWRKLTPTEKRTAVSYCMPPSLVEVSPTVVAAAVDRLYAGGPSAGRRIDAACAQAVSGFRTMAEARRTMAEARDRGARKGVSQASKALALFCPDDPAFLQPKKVASLTNKLAVAYGQSPDPAKDRPLVVAAVAKLDAGCGPSAPLQKALKKTPAGQAAQKSGAAGARKLTGSGPQELGDLVVRRVSDLRWSRGGGAPYFSVTEDQGRLSFLSEGSRGYRAVAPGTYRDVWVDTDGPWTVVITPRYPRARG